MILTVAHFVITLFLLLEIQTEFLYYVNVKEGRPEAKSPGAEHEDETPPCTPPSNRTWMESKEELVSDELTAVLHVLERWNTVTPLGCRLSVVTEHYFAKICEIMLCCFWQKKLL